MDQSEKLKEAYNLILMHQATAGQPGMAGPLNPTSTLIPTTMVPSMVPTSPVVPQGGMTGISIPFKFDLTGKSDLPIYIHFGPEYCSSNGVDQAASLVERVFDGHLTVYTKKEDREARSERHASRSRRDRR